MIFNSVGWKIVTLSVALGLSSIASASSPRHWFELFKDEASPEELYRFLYNMPKGGDLHNHLSGAGLPVWWYELALEASNKGYQYYTKVQINNCRPHHQQDASYRLLFRNIQQSSWQQLDACERDEHKLLQKLNQEEKQAWLNSLELDRPGEGRAEFFNTHWQRLNILHANPYIINEILFRNMQAFGDEGLLYLETQSGSHGFINPDGSPIDPERIVTLYKERLNQADAKATGVTVRLQNAVLRFLPGAEEELKTLYQFNLQHPELYVGLNLVGVEENGKGYPLRFLDSFRQLRKRHAMPLSIHAGESDEPNFHIRDTLLLGAQRIGHGLNLIKDPQTMLMMQDQKRLIEINLISNLLLEYVGRYDEHPFPEYLRTGIPVALSTDDRGMWSSNMTDEFYVAVTEFNLSWPEILVLSRNSISYGFLPESLKQELLTKFEDNIASFERNFKRGGLALAAKKKPVRYQFFCRFRQWCGGSQ